MGFVFLSFGGRLRVWCCCKTKFLMILGVGCVFLYLGRVLILVGLVIYFIFWLMLICYLVVSGVGGFGGFEVWFGLRDFEFCDTEFLVILVCWMKF